MQIFLSEFYEYFPTLAKTISLTSCVDSSKLPLPASLLNFFLNFFGGKPVKGEWRAMKARYRYRGFVFSCFLMIAIDSWKGLVTKNYDISNILPLHTYSLKTYPHSHNWVFHFFSDHIPSDVCWTWYWSKWSSWHVSIMWRRCMCLSSPCSVMCGLLPHTKEAVKSSSSWKIIRMTEA